MMAKVSIFCFAASYAVALAIELWRLLRPRPILRYVGLGFGSAGLLAHLIYALVQSVPLVTPAGSMLLLALVLAVFYLYGAVHHNRVAWGLFVLPLVLGLIVLAVLMPPTELPRLEGVDWIRFWGMTHGVFVLMAAVGVCVGFLASIMYLVQMRKLQTKSMPDEGLRMMPLERLETMNRRAILLAFPLLTVGLLVGVALQWRTELLTEAWTSPKVLSTIGLWIVFALLLYLRYAAHVRGRRLAWLTMIAFGLLIAALAPAHPFAGGAGP